MRWMASTSSIIPSMMGGIIKIARMEQDTVATSVDSLDEVDGQAEVNSQVEQGSLWMR